jgi:hypothetical protein
MVAMANTGGGYIIIGAMNDGSSSGADLTGLAAVDQAVVVDKVAKYTDIQPSDISFKHFKWAGGERLIFYISPSDIPIVFSKPGTYAVGEKQKNAFSAGMIYFRHGSKSEPARQGDIDRAFQAMFLKRRNELLEGISQVVRAGPGEKVVVLPKAAVVTDDANAFPVRVTDNPLAPEVRGLVSSGKYSSCQEELAGVVRDMETDPEAFAAAAQLWRFYMNRRSLTEDPKSIGFILTSSLNRRCPPYYWAYRLRPAHALKVIEEESSRDTYPSVALTVRLAFAIGGNGGRHVVEKVAGKSRYPSARKLAKRLLPLIGVPGRVWQECGSSSIRVLSSTGSEIHRLSEATPKETELLIDRSPFNHSNYGAIKKLDAIVYGSMLEKEGRGAT